jgi:hypothetical protein
MKRLFSVWPRYAALFCIAACAGGAPSSADPVPERVDPPQMLSRGIPPQLRIPATTSGRSPVRVTIEVMIDSTGLPEMSTFKASGFGAAENQDALRRWIQQLMFRPAHLGSQPVRGLYRTKLEARVQAR